MDSNSKRELIISELTKEVVNSSKLINSSVANVKTEQKNDTTVYQHWGRNEKSNRDNSFRSIKPYRAFERKLVNGNRKSPGWRNYKPSARSCDCSTQRNVCARGARADKDVLEIGDNNCARPDAYMNLSNYWIYEKLRYQSVNVFLDEEHDEDSSRLSVTREHELNTYGIENDTVGFHNEDTTKENTDALTEHNRKEQRERCVNCGSDIDKDELEAGRDKHKTTVNKTKKNLDINSTQINNNRFDNENSKNLCITSMTAKYSGVRRVTVKLRQAQFVPASTFDRVSVYQGGPNVIKPNYKSMNSKRFENIPLYKDGFTADIWKRSKNVQEAVFRGKVSQTKAVCDVHNPRGGVSRTTVRLAAICPRYTGPESLVLNFEALRISAHLERLKKKVQAGKVVAVGRPASYRGSWSPTKVPCTSAVGSDT